MRAILEAADLAVDVLAPGELMPEVDETGDTLEENARLKAEALKERIEVSAWAVADDTGLMVDALNGAPGVYSARFAGPDCSFADNNWKLLKSMERVPDEERTALFVTCIVAVGPDGQSVALEGICQGKIISEFRGDAGFGYDPIFQPIPGSKTYAEMGAAEKNKISHRGQAVKMLVEWIRDNI